jgi:hypothetical protein
VYRCRIFICRIHSEFVRFLSTINGVPAIYVTRSRWDACSIVEQKKRALYRVFVRKYSECFVNHLAIPVQAEGHCLAFV